MTEGKGIALAILGVVAVIAVVGLVLLFTGATGKVSLGKGPWIEQPAQRLCDDISCSNGLGAVVLGEEEHLDGGYWVCGCPAQFVDKHIADWSNQWKGDEAHDGLDYGNYEVLWRIRKIREY